MLSNRTRIRGLRAPQKLSRRQAIPVAIGSIAGSGILFLPSAVFAESGSASLLVWLLAAAMCLPMLLMFEDIVRANPESDGIESFVRLGLGDAAARCVPVLFVSLVVVGLPAGAMVAGRYVAQAFGGGDALVVVCAISLLVVALLANAFGARASTRIQHGGTMALLAMALVLIGVAAFGGSTDLHAVEPRVGDLDTVLPTAMLAFWAFAGFENLTFLSREFRNPQRDFLPVSATALTTYGVLTILLAVAVAARIPQGRVNEVTGLLQLADTVRSRLLVVSAVAVIAFSAMAINAVAWLWGISRLMVRAADTDSLPRQLATTNAAAVPRRALIVLAFLLAVGTTVLAAFPGIVLDAIGAAGGIFAVLYMLSIVSYVRARGFTARSVPNVALLIVLAVALAQSGWRSLYALITLAAALLAQAISTARRSSRSHGSCARR